MFAIRSATTRAAHRAYMAWGPFRRWKDTSSLLLKLVSKLSNPTIHPNPRRRPPGSHRPAFQSLGSPGAFSVICEDVGCGTSSSGSIMHGLHSVAPTRLSCLVISPRYLQKPRKRYELKGHECILFQGGDGCMIVSGRVYTNWPPVPPLL